MGLKKLSFGHSKSVDLTPLSSIPILEELKLWSSCEDGLLEQDLIIISKCCKLKKLILSNLMVADVSHLSSIPMLEELDLSTELGPDLSIKDLCPLSQCKQLKKLDISGNVGIVDLFPLSLCPNLEELCIFNLPFIKSLSIFENGFTNLRALDIHNLHVDDLSPLIKLQRLEEVTAYRIPPTTSLLPLVRCVSLKKLICSFGARRLIQLRKDLPDLEIIEL